MYSSYWNTYIQGLPPLLPFPSSFENAQKKMAKITAPAFMTHTHRRGEGRGEEEGKQTLNIFILLVNIPVDGIKLLDAVCLLLGKRRCARQKTPCAFCSGVVSAWCRPLRKSDVWPVELLTRWPFQKRTPQGQFQGPPTYTHQVWWRSVKGPRRSRGTNEQTDRQTNAARIIVWWYAFHRTYIQLTSSKTPTLMENHVGSFYE